MKLSEDRRKLLKVASLYYHDGLTQAEIAKMMGISRPIISKMLQRAKEQGIVTIHIKDENAKAVQLANDLIRQYDLQEAIVVASEEGHQELQQRVAQAAAAYLSHALSNVRSIGISWGTTLAQVVEAMPYEKWPQITVRPLVGGVASQHVDYDTNHLAFRLGEKLGASCSYLYAPALAESQVLAKVLNQSQMVIDALEHAKAVDVALIGVGNPQQTSTWRQLGYLSGECLADQRIVGDAVGSLFDKNGKTIDNTISERMIGLKVEELAIIPTTILVGAGVEKRDPIKALLRGKGINVLVVDLALGKSLLKSSTALSSHYRKGVNAQ